jgi:hypothetical protein
MKPLLVASCISALLAAGPLVAQTPPAGSAGPRPPAAAPIPGTQEQGRPVPPTDSMRPGTMQDPTAPRPPLGAGSDRPTPGAPADRMGSPSERSTGSDRPIDDPPRRGGRISETAPAPSPGGTAPSRFQADLRTCDTLERESRASCRQEMFAARAQGLYRN